MNCPLCNYALSDLEITCPRCKGQALQAQKIVRHGGLAEKTVEKHAQKLLETWQDGAIYLISFFFPIAGLAIFLIFRNDDHHIANLGSVGAGMGVAVGAMLAIVFSGIGLGR